MSEKEMTIARLGLVAVAISLWRCAGPLIFDGLLPRQPLAVVLLCLTYVASFAALLLAVSSSEKVARYAGAASVAFVFGVLVFAFRDDAHKDASEFYPTTDGHVFMETAARYLLAGKNPYAERLGDAFRIYRLPLSHVTPLLDGDFSDRQAYPALSFLVLVPALLLHVPTYLVYAFAFVASVAIVVHAAPTWARPLVVAAFVLDESFFAFAFGGVTDTVWALFLVGAIVWWRKRPVAAAVLVGLACAYKQHPFFMVPLLVLRVAYDTGEKPWGPAARRFVAIVVGVFVVVNLPFVLVGPHRWLLGVTEPLVAPMVQLSEGLTSLSMTGYIPMPRKGTSIVFWSAYVVALVVYARHTRALRDWCWIAPGIVLWFSYRALMSYWYFFALTAFAAIATAYAERDEDATREHGVDLSWRPTVGVVAAFVLGVGVFLVWCANRPAPYAVSLVGPIQAWERAGVVLQVKVENRLPHVTTPQFWVQSSALQPMPWLTESGAGPLGPGESGVYTIRSPRPYADFDVTEGARLEVHDRGEPGIRAYISVKGERSIKIVDAVPNPDFRVVELRSKVPSGWTFESSVAKVVVPTAPTDSPARLAFEFDAPREAPLPLVACVAQQHVGGLEGQRRAVLSSVLPVPEGKLTFQVNVPANANVPPYETLYGVALAIKDFHVVVLFGDAVEKGTLPSGETFVSIPVQRGVWRTVQVSPRELLERLQAPLVMQRYMYLRAPILDFASIPLELGLLAQAPGAAKMEFGRIEQEIVRDFELIAKRTSGPGLAAWRAELDFANGNYKKAADRLQAATAEEPTRERSVKLADALSLSGERERARDVYLDILAHGGSVEAEEGLGFTLLSMGDLEGARAHLERARDAYKDIERTPPRAHYLATVGGLARIHAKRGECDRARALRDEVTSEAPSLPAPDIKPCP